MAENQNKLHLSASSFKKDNRPLTFWLYNFKKKILNDLDIQLNLELKNNVQYSLKILFFWDTLYIFDICMYIQVSSRLRQQENQDPEDEFNGLTGMLKGSSIIFVYLYT